MKVIITVAVLFFTLLSLLVGTLLFAMGINLVSANLFSNFIIQIYQSPNFSFITIILGILFIIIGFLILHLLERILQKEKTITLSNKGGKITIAVSVIEDLVKKSVENLLDVKEIKSKIDLKKKGVKITSKIALFSTANIPQISNEIQKTIEEQVKQSLELNENVDVEVYVSKVVEKSDKEKIKEKQEIARRITVGD